MSQLIGFQVLCHLLDIGQRLLLKMIHDLMNAIWLHFEFVPNATKLYNSGLSS